MCKGSSKRTFSAAYSAGLSPCDSQDGQTIGLFGQEVVPANHFRAPVSDKGTKTNGTCGRNCIASSASVILARCLANKLQAATDLAGSTEYHLTWKQSVMPSQRVIYRLRASARRTFGNVCGGWPTPNIPNRGAESRESKRKRGSGGVDLQTVAQLAGWPTPRAEQDNGTLEAHLKWKAKWGGANVSSLPIAAQLAGWTTPQAHDTTPRGAGNRANPKGGGACLAWDARGVTPSPSPAPTGNLAGSVLNPAFSLWLQGYPAEWASCGERAMRSSRK